MYSQKTQALHGYLDVKLPKVGGTKFKSWDRYWVVFRPMHDAAAKRSVVSVYFYTDKNAATKPFPNKTTLLLDSVTSVKRTTSKKRPYAFAVNCSQPLIMFAGRTETESQRLIWFLRDIFWPPILLLEPASDFHEVSVIENSYAQKLGLSGNYWLKILTTSVSLHDVIVNSEIRHWKLAYLRRFFLSTSEYKSDLENLLVLQAGPQNSGGEGDLVLFSEEARKILRHIMTCVQNCLEMQQQSSDTGTVMRRKSSSTTTAMRNMLARSVMVGQGAKFSFGSTISDESGSDSFSERSSIAVIDDDDFVHVKKQDVLDELDTSSMTVSDRISDGVFSRPQTVRNRPQKADSFGPTIRSNVSMDRGQPIPRSNSYTPTAIASPAKQDTITFMQNTDVETWVNCCDPTYGRLADCSNEQVTPTTPEENIYAALGDCYSISPVKMRSQDNDNDKRLQEKMGTDDIKTNVSRLSQEERLRKVSSDSTHMYTEGEFNKELEKMQSSAKSKSENNITKDEVLYEEIKSFRTFHKNLKSFFGTDEYEIHEEPTETRVPKKQQNPKLQRQASLEKIRPPPKLPPDLPDRPKLLNVKLAEQNKTVHEQASPSSPSVRKQLFASRQFSREVSITEETPRMLPLEKEAEYNDVKSTQQQNSRDSPKKDLRFSMRKNDKLPDIPLVSPLLIKAANNSEMTTVTKTEKQRKTNRKGSKASNSSLGSSPINESDMDLDLLVNKTSPKSKSRVMSMKDVNTPISPLFDFELSTVEQQFSTYSTFTLNKETKTETNVGSERLKHSHSVNCNDCDDYDIPTERNINKHKQEKATSQSFDDGDYDTPASVQRKISNSLPTTMLFGKKQCALPTVKPKPKTTRVDTPVLPPVEPHFENNDSTGETYEVPPIARSLSPPAVQEKSKKTLNSPKKQAANGASGLFNHNGSFPSPPEDVYDIPPFPQKPANNDEDIYENTDIGFYQNRTELPLPPPPPPPDEYHNMTLSQSSSNPDAGSLNQEYENVYIDDVGRCIIRNSDGTEIQAGSI